MLKIKAAEKSKLFESFKQMQDNSKAEPETEKPRPPKRIISIDIEADGRSPTRHSMLSIGAVVCDEAGNVLETWERNLLPIPGREAEVECMEEFWSKHPEAWDYATTNAVEPSKAMKDLIDLFLRHGGKEAVEWVAKPAAYDWQWLNGYYAMFREPDWPDIGFSATCISTMKKAAVEMCTLTTRAGWDTLEAAWTNGLPRNSHRALDDARYQAMVYFGAKSLLGQVKGCGASKCNV